jgi:hypothetical protein
MSMSMSMSMSMADTHTQTRTIEVPSPFKRRWTRTKGPDWTEHTHTPLRLL